MNTLRMRRQLGFTLIELMVSVGLGLFLVLGTAGVYVNSRQGFRALESSARLMENGRVASEIMHRSIRMARYWGCPGQLSSNVQNHLGRPQHGIHGVDGAGGAPDELVVYQANDSTAVPLLDIDDANLGTTNPVPLSSSASVVLRN